MVCFWTSLYILGAFVQQVGISGLARLPGYVEVDRWPPEDPVHDDEVVADQIREIHFIAKVVVDHVEGQSGLQGV